MSIYLYVVIVLCFIQFFLYLTDVAIMAIDTNTEKSRLCLNVGFVIMVRIYLPGINIDIDMCIMIMYTSKKWKFLKVIWIPNIHEYVSTWLYNEESFTQRGPYMTYHSGNYYSSSIIIIMIHYGHTISNPYSESQSEPYVFQLISDEIAVRNSILIVSYTKEKQHRLD